VVQSSRIFPTRRQAPASPNKEGLMQPDASSHKTSYADVKTAIRQLIEAGGWKPGVRLPSERELEARFNCARLTVRRALQELQIEGLVVRRHGSGSYVADLVPISNILTIKDIHREIVDRGHRHDSRVLSRKRMRASPAIASAMELQSGDEVFFCEVLHFENGAPLQLEERYINPSVVPDFLSLDLDTRTPSSHLFSRAPLTAAEQIVEAVNADRSKARHLQVEPGEALLRVSRRTLSQGRVASIARLYHPGKSYRLMGAFSADN
jgi:GntR family histidine utilization transcriptional repressor